MDPKNPVTVAPALDATATYPERRGNGRTEPATDAAETPARDSDQSELAAATTAAATSGALSPAGQGHPVRPSRYGRYELLGELGAGGMGVVYEAYDPELDRKVALKVIGDSQRRLGALGRERLVREARAMAKLTHTNVIVIHDVGSVGDEAFVAMELVHGRTLKDWLRDGSRDHAALLDAFAQAGRGLEAAHAAGLVHRDFKPSNVMVGNDGRVRVLDFGLARTVEPDSETAGGRASADGPSQVSTLTQTGALVGTPAYMAPEQLRGESVDERTDQFSFCVALYEALYGAPPFSGTSIDERAEQVVSGSVRRPPDKRGISPRLREAVLRGLRPDPRERHPSMAVLLGALEPISRPSRVTKSCSNTRRGRGERTTCGRGSNSTARRSATQRSNALPVPETLWWWFVSATKGPRDSPPPPARMWGAR